MMESPHNYENRCSDVWKYTLAGARELVVIFDERTEMEEGFDYLFLYDASGKEVGRYTGKELAGQTLTVEGERSLIIRWYSIWTSQTTISIIIWMALPAIPAVFIYNILTAGTGPTEIRYYTGII